MARVAHDLPMNWSVQEFLERFQTTLVLAPPLWHDTGRRLAEIQAIGLTRNQVIEELKNLKPTSHHRGPEPDDAEPASLSALHIFKHPLEGTSIFVYVKIALKVHPNKKSVLIAKIWSFKQWS